MVFCEVMVTQIVLLKTLKTQSQRVGGVSGGVGMKTEASCPGKVLIAGGYLVLDRKYSGLVVSSDDARVHVELVLPDGLEQSSQRDTNTRIRIESPQFVDAIWNYSLGISGWSDSVGPSVSILAEGNSRNAYIESTLRITLSVISNLLKRSGRVFMPPRTMDIRINADNDFYSFPDCDRTELPRFAHTKSSLLNAHKTGLGSSAALITALVAVLFSSFLNDHDRELVHNTAQLCHCFVQGKVR